MEQEEAKPALKSPDKKNIYLVMRTLYKEKTKLKRWRVLEEEMKKGKSRGEAWEDAKRIASVQSISTIGNMKDTETWDWLKEHFPKHEQRILKHYSQLKERYKP